MNDISIILFINFVIFLILCWKEEFIIVRSQIMGIIMVYCDCY